MTIKETEERSGMTRANIRFYEKEGLIHPERGGNGYRDYSEEDLEALNRIRLLRTLRVPLEEIKTLQQGACGLSELLERHEEALKAEEKAIEGSVKICGIMRRDRVEYGNMNAAHYLAILERAAEHPLPDLEEDAEPEVSASLRRFFARALDYALYAVLLDAAVILCFGPDGFIGGVYGAPLAVVLMLFLEPLQLKLFGTTFGKWLLGLRVTNIFDGRLTYGEALSRTFRVLMYGTGFYFPVIGLYRLWKSVRDNENGLTLPWEYESTLHLKDTKPWRAVCYTAAWGGIAFLLFAAVRASVLPVNRGEISVAEFCENYNAYMGDKTYILTESGEMTESRHPEGLYEITVGRGRTKPVFRFLERDGVMTGLEFTVEVNDSGEWIPGYKNEMRCAVMALAKAREQGFLFPGAAERIVDKIGGTHFQNFDFEENGIRVSCRTDSSGYAGSGEVLLPVEEDARFFLRFTLEVH